MKVLIVPGSARPNSVGKEVISFIESDLSAREGVEVTVATFDDINLPFLDTPFVPAFEDYVIPHESVAAWTAKVDEADVVVFAVPEYNGSMTGIQKNAIDWVYKQWNGKKAAVVTYNFYEKKSAVEAILPVLRVVQLTLVEPVVGLRIGEEFAPDGTVLDEASVKAKIALTKTNLLEPVPVV